MSGASYPAPLGCFLARLPGCSSFFDLFFDFFLLPQIHKHLQIPSVCFILLWFFILLRRFILLRSYILRDYILFMKYHASRPSGTAAIDVVGVLETSSKLVLRSISIALRDMLVDNPAYSFVVYVESANLSIKFLEHALSGTATSFVPPSHTYTYLKAHISLESHISSDQACLWL